MSGSRQEDRTINAGLEFIVNGVYASLDSWTSSRLRQHKFSHIIFVDRKTATTGNARNDHNDLDPNEFECLELNFESAAVLPNLYKSDKFIAKSLANYGKVLILESSSAKSQKCIAIVLGYLMYNFELSFWHAYEALRKIYRPKFELEHYLVIQLYEYEPILEVRRAAEETGHSRSGERLRTALKRSHGSALDSSYEHETATIIHDSTEGDDHETLPAERNSYSEDCCRNSTNLPPICPVVGVVDETMAE